jgi:long-chain fatty acid transport protein
MRKEEEFGMQRRTHSLWLAGVLCLVTTVVGSPLMAAGFSLLFEQGAKSMGVAGAFTATADDPSAMFYNVGGLAFLKEREFQAGVTLVSSSGSEFTGAGPLAGVVEEMNSLSELLPHFYWVQPMTERWTFGFAVNSPFGLVTEWDPEGFSGRYISTKGSLTSVDLSGNFGWQATDRLGIGFGAILRAHLPGLRSILQRWCSKATRRTRLAGMRASCTESTIPSPGDSATGVQSTWTCRATLDSPRS